ncbi:MAG: prepilin-type N-terminal cleavage/methylation domain-containing protein [Deltaproteobacteria bacterium]|nr:prepilin-type N-terminal cleavage/methylation domain-containing protein [Deltaproteobacteria bacterium]
MRSFGWILKNKRGFTFMEIMLVLVIVAILTAISIPAVMKWLPNYRLKRASRDLYSRLQLTKMAAIKTNTVCAVVYNPAGNSYQVLSDPGPDGIWNTADDTDAHPGPDGVHGNADDIAEKSPISLFDYGRNVRYGPGNAVFDATIAKGALPADNVSHTNNTVLLASTGLATNLGYVYLANNNGTAYAIGIPTVAGAIELKAWLGNDWD